MFTGAPPAAGSPNPVPLELNAVISLLTGGHFFEATSPMGTISVTVSSAAARDGGTRGDYCVRGTLTATLADTNPPPRLPNLQLTVNF